MVDMESAVHTGKHKKINSGGTAENRKYTSSMDVVYLHRHCPEIKKTVENFKICVQFLLTSAKGMRIAETFFSHYKTPTLKRESQKVFQYEQKGLYFFRL